MTSIYPRPKNSAATVDFVTFSTSSSRKDEKTACIRSLGTAALIATASSPSTSVEQSFDTYRQNTLKMLSTSLGFSGLRGQGHPTALVCAVLLIGWSTGHEMLKISTVDTNSERRLIVEGKLISPWVGELRKSWSVAAADLNGRKLVVDLTNATVIGQEGKDALFELMQEGAKFCCCGVLTKHMLKELAVRYQNRMQNSDWGHSSS